MLGIRGMLWVCVIAATLPEPAKGQEPPAAKAAEPSLKAGMAAPAFQVEAFLKGAPFKGFEKGRVYVVEFWATWCGPCVMAMPHLSELQREYAEKKVTICGVNVWQEHKYTEGTLGKVKAFVEAKGAVMDYTVAYDGAAGFMADKWVKAAGRDGIPCSFVVDREGKIAWIGAPSLLDMVIDEVVRGVWDVSGGSERLAAAVKAYRDAGEKYKESVAAGDAAWEEAEKRYPALGRARALKRVGAMLGAQRVAEACVLGGRMLEEGVKSKNVGLIQGVLEALDAPGALKEPAARELLLKAAKANFDLADAGEPGPHVVLARGYFFAGQVEKGRAEAKRALELAAPESRAGMEKWLKEIEEEAGK